MAFFVGINGMGVVGRELARQILFNQDDNNRMELSIINDPNITIDNLAYLLQHDSVYHDYGTQDIKIIDYDRLRVNGKDVYFYQEASPEKVGWADQKADFVFECSGQAKTATDLQGFITGGAKTILATYYVPETAVVCYGVNQEVVKREDHFLSMPAIEDQVGAIVFKVLNDNYIKVSEALIKPFCAYTNAQQTIDSLYPQTFERGRAGAWNIVPFVGSNAGTKIGNVFADINGRVNGMIYRAPVIVGGAMDVTVMLENKDTPDDIGDAFLKADSEIITATNTPLASSDVVGLEQFQFLTTGIRQINLLTSMCVLYDNIRGQVLQALRLTRYMKIKDLI